MRPRLAQIHNSGATAGQGPVSDGTAWTLVDVATQAELNTHAAAADPHTGYVQEALLDAKGDLFVASAADTVARLPVGTNDHVLTADSTQAAGVKWAAPIGIQATLFDAKGDLVVASAADTAARLAVGTNGQILTADSAEATGVKWATSTALTDPTTTAGDLIRRNAASTALERLGIGTAGQVLTVVSGAPAWAATSTTYPKVAYSAVIATKLFTVAAETAISTTNDVTIAAAVGDRVEIGAQGEFGAAAQSIYLVGKSMVSGSPVNNIANYPTAWRALVGQSTSTPFGGSTFYTVLAGDLSGGNLTVRIYGALDNDGTDRSAVGVQFSVKNWGP